MTDRPDRQNPPPGWRRCMYNGEDRGWCVRDDGVESYADAWAVYDEEVAPALAARMAEVREWLRSESIVCELTDHQLPHSHAETLALAADALAARWPDPKEPG